MDFPVLRARFQYYENCTSYLMIRNGRFPDSPPLDSEKYCGRHAFPRRSLFTTGNSAYIEYSGPTYSLELKLAYREITDSCDEEIALTLFENSTEISSPNYPNAPIPHIECIWKIRAPAGRLLRIDFHERFDLFSDDECTKEYIEIRDGGTAYSDLIHKFCAEVPSSQFTTDNMMYVKFFTDTDTPRNGFKATVSLAGCGGTIRGKSGEIQSPLFNSPHSYPLGINCTWHLIVPDDRIIAITFKKIDLEPASDCRNVDHVTVYEKNKWSNQVRLVGTFCGNVVPKKIRLDGKEAIIRFETGARKPFLSHFSLRFTSTLDLCAKTIRASAGTFQSPNYPTPQNGSLYCYWLIIVPLGRRVTVEVTDFGATNERFNTLKFYNAVGLKAFIKSSTAFSQDKIISSSENRMVVAYSGSDGSRGFKAKFSSNEPSLCEGDFDQSEGVIVQPQVVLPSYVCTYTRHKFSANTTLGVTLKIVIGNNIPERKPSCNNVYILFSSGLLSPSDGFRICPRTGSFTFKTPLPFTEILAHQGNGMLMNFTISYNTYPCGGTINDEIGSIFSPDYPNKSSKSVVCSWLLTLPAEQNILLKFHNLDLGKMCDKHHLKIYNGNLFNRPLLGRYCGNVIPKPIKSQTNSLWIEYTFEEEATGTGFNVTFEPAISGCGGIFHRERIIQTPSYPNQYPNNAECVWEVRSAEGYYIVFSFISRFQIEQSDNCEHDFLEIWDWLNNTWMFLGRKCGRQIPESVKSTSNRMKILFRSNNNVTGHGFRAKWEWKCGGTFHADEIERFIDSSHLFHKIDCEWLIVRNTNEFTNIKFYHFDIIDEEKCLYQNTSVSYISSGKSEKISYEGNVPPDLRLKEDIRIVFNLSCPEGLEYRFSYQTDDCGGVIDSPSTISSPPLNSTSKLIHTSHIECIWNVTAPPKKNVIVRFEYFNLPYLQRCLPDYLNIYDSDKQHLIAHLCGNFSKDPPAFKSKSNLMTLHFHARLTTGHSGFRATVLFVDGPDAGCGGEINIVESTVLSSPSLEDMDCTWMIYSLNGTNIEIHLSELNLPSTCQWRNHILANCSCGFLEIIDGEPPLFETIEKFCAITGSNFRREFLTTGRRVTMRLYTRGITNKAFVARLTPMATSPCTQGNLEVTKDIKTLRSPGYPDGYPNDIKCTWALRGNTKFVVRFTDFDLSEDRDHHLRNTCDEDRVQIIDNPDHKIIRDGFGARTISSGGKHLTTDFLQSEVTGVYQFCGKSTKPFDYYYSHYALPLKIIFSSGKSRRRGRGFKIEYHFIDCSRNYTALQGRILYEDFTECYNSIIVPENYTISLFYQQLRTAPAENCALAGVEIRDGESKSAPLVHRACGYLLPSPVFSSSNNLWIHSWNTKNALAAYDIVYTSSNQGRGCGGVLYNYKGRFSSPLYPQEYKSEVPCAWDVRVPVGLRMAITFSVFNFQGECNDTYVKVTTYDQTSSNDHIFCSTDNPATLYSSSHLLVTYQSSARNNGTGWLALFEAV